MRPTHTRDLTMKHSSFFKASLVMLVSVISLLMPQKISAQYKVDNLIKANNILQYNGKDFIPTNKTIEIESVVDYYTGELYKMNFMIMDGTAGEGYGFEKGSYWGISSIGYDQDIDNFCLLVYNEKKSISIIANMKGLTDYFLIFESTKYNGDRVIFRIPIDDNKYFAKKISEQLKRFSNAGIILGMSKDPSRNK